MFWQHYTGPIYFIIYYSCSQCGNLGAAFRMRSCSIFDISNAVCYATCSFSLIYVLYMYEKYDSLILLPVHEKYE